MLITCPSCKTQFNLPDELVRKTAHLRCSVCKHVFGLPDASGQMPGQGADSAPDQAGVQPDDYDIPQDEASEESADSGLSLGGKPGSRKFSGGKKPRGKLLLVCLVLLLLVAGGGAAAWMFAGDMIREHLPFGLGQQAAAPTADMI
ncbi:MAG: zinc-ribbon domain-containing protein, partial [Deltaproteobacteria bacterium]|nr:zinc-ribbon domain-containing protein [Deltaproteobacteria bacterium]